MIYEMMEQFFDWYDSAEYVAAYNARREALRELFSRYQTATGKDKDFMNWLLSANASYSRQYSKAEMQRKHNTFVLRFVAGLSVKEIARHHNVSTGTVHRDIAAVLDNMMVFAFGVDGIVPYEWVPACN